MTTYGSVRTSGIPNSKFSTGGLLVTVQCGWYPVVPGSRQGRYYVNDVPSLHNSSSSLIIRKRPEAVINITQRNLPVVLRYTDT